jgi:hypothetical protein
MIGFLWISQIGNYVGNGEMENQYKTLSDGKNKEHGEGKGKGKGKGKNLFPANLHSDERYSFSPKLWHGTWMESGRNSSQLG